MKVLLFGAIHFVEFAIHTYAQSNTHEQWCQRSALSSARLRFINRGCESSISLSCRNGIESIKEHA